MVLKVAGGVLMRSIPLVFFSNKCYTKTTVRMEILESEGECFHADPGH